MNDRFERKRQRKRKRRIINRIIGLVFLVILLLVGNIVVNKTMGLRYEKFSSLDKALFEEISLVYDTFGESNQGIWTENYRLDKTPVVLAGRNSKVSLFRGSTYVLNMDLSGKSYAKKIELPNGLWQGDVYRIAGITPFTLKFLLPITDYTTIKIDGQEIPAMKYNWDSFHRADSEDSIDGTLVKQGFRDYMQTKTKLPEQQSIDVYPYSTENFGLKGMEFKILDKMLAAKGEEELNSFIRDFVAVREARYSGNDTLAYEEPLSEMTLGCEQYTYYKLSKLLQRNYSFFEKTPDTYISFEEAFKGTASGTFSKDAEAFFEQDSLYESGAALCFVLDMLPLGNGWKSAIEIATKENLVTPYSLLKDYCVKYCGGYKDVDMNALKATYHFENLKNISGSFV